MCPVHGCILRTGTSERAWHCLLRAAWVIFHDPWVIILHRHHLTTRLQTYSKRRNFLDATRFSKRERCGCSDVGQRSHVFFCYQGLKRRLTKWTKKCLHVAEVNPLNLVQTSALRSKRFEVKSACRIWRDFWKSCVSQNHQGHLFLLFTCR